MASEANSAVAIASIPVIDVSSFATGTLLPSPEALEVAAVIDRTCRELGFLLVKGHGVRQSTKENLLAKMREFFALPVEEKEKIAIGKSQFHRGYIGIGDENLEGALADTELQATSGVGDLKEGIDSGLEQGPSHREVIAGTPLHGPNQLPNLPGYREAWQEYFDEGYEAVRRLQRGVALALNLDPNFFEDQPGEPMLHLRMLHYPPSHKVNTTLGRIGCGAHTDYGTITVLCDDGVGGLQVRRRDGEWIDVQVPDGHLVVNLGDLLAIWTNDRYVSNPHRVINPPELDRYSIPLFVTPPFHLTIEALETCVVPGEEPRHAPMVSGAYLLSRFDGTHNYRDPLLEDGE